MEYKIILYAGLLAIFCIMLMGAVFNVIVRPSSINNFYDVKQPTVYSANGIEGIVEMNGYEGAVIQQDSSIFCRGKYYDVRANKFGRKINVGFCCDIFGNCVVR